MLQDVLAIVPPKMGGQFFGTLYRPVNGEAIRVRPREIDNAIDATLDGQARWYGREICEVKTAHRTVSYPT